MAIRSNHGRCTSLFKDHNEVHPGNIVCGWLPRARFPFINFPSRNANTVGKPSSPLTKPSLPPQFSNPKGRLVVLPLAYRALRVKLNGRYFRPTPSLFVPVPTEECTTSAWFSASVWMTSTLIFPCWIDGAAATKEPIKRTIAVVRCILELMWGTLWFLNYLLKEICLKIFFSTALDRSKYGRKWRNLIRKKKKKKKGSSPPI